MCNCRHFLWNFSPMELVRLPVKRTISTSFKVWSLLLMCCTRDVYLNFSARLSQCNFDIKGLEMIVWVRRIPLKQTLFGNFFFQEPFEQLPDVFKEKLSSSEKASLNRVLRKIDMDIFLPQLLQIILLNVKKDGETISTMRYRRRACRNVPFYNTSIK